MTVGSGLFAKYVERLVAGYAPGDSAVGAVHEPGDGTAAGGEYMSELASESVSQRLRPVTSRNGPTEPSEGER